MTSSVGHQSRALCYWSVGVNVRYSYQEGVRVYLQHRRSVAQCVAFIVSKAVVRNVPIRNLLRLLSRQDAQSAGMLSLILQWLVVEGFNLSIMYMYTNEMAKQYSLRTCGMIATDISANCTSVCCTSRKPFSNLHGPNFSFCQTDAPVNRIFGYECYNETVWLCFINVYQCTPEKKLTFAFSSTRFCPGPFMAKRYILQQKCLNGQMGTCLQWTRWCSF